MGQKVNPHGLRVGVIKNWDSRWYAADEKFGDILVQDYKIREYVKNTLVKARDTYMPLRAWWRGKRYQKQAPAEHRAWL